ncbi:MAG TPA: PAS domain S-box protein, partial [Thermoleophilia bacterium]|nr:PAS domain S-box protein [Thermoleophilia bacterium]
MSHNSLRSQWAPPRLLFRVPPQASHLRRARERIRDYLGQYYDDDDLIHDLVLCIEEAATNAIRHGGADHDIEITLQFDDGRLVATVKDRGRGFDVSSFDPRRTPDPASDHGRGLFIISALTDSLELSLDGGVEVRMARRATPRAAPAQLESGLAEPRAMPQLEDRDARTRAMLDEVDEAFVALDWEYRYVHANRTALRMLGMSARQLYGHSLWEVFPQLSDTPLGEAFHAALELGRPSVTEHRSVVNGDWLEVRIYPTSVGVSVYYREINERKRLERERERAELQLLESREHERFLADVVEQAEAPFGVGAPDGRLIFCNAAFADLTGYSREELEQKAVTWAQDLTPVEWRATESALLAEAVAQRRAVRYEKEYLRKDGTRVPIELFV